MKGDLRAGARQVGWTATVYAGVHLTAALLVRNATGSAAIEALVAELGAGRIGVTWSDPEAPVPDGSAIARRAGRGAAMGLGVAAAMLLVGALTGGVRLVPSRASGSQLVLGAIVVALTAVRDELVLRGMVLRAFGPLVSEPWRVIIAGLAAAAAMGLDAPPMAMVAAGLFGAGLAILWLRDRGAWLAWGAHVGYAFLLGPLTRGGPLDARAMPGLWGGGDFGPEGGLAGVVVLAVAAAAAWMLLLRTTRKAA